MKIYVAAPYSLRDQAIDVMKALEARGMTVTSTWLMIIDSETPETAEQDLSDIYCADAVVLLNPREYADKGTGGRHFEAGYAYSIGKPIVLIGARTNIFHQLPRVYVYDTLEDVAWDAILN